MEDFNVVNDTQAGNVDQSTEVVQAQETTAQVESVESGVADQRPVQDRDTNAMFAKVRREAEQKARDSMIAEMYGQSHGIYTYDQYQQVLAEQKAQEEAQRIGVDPQFYQEFNSIKTKLNTLEREKSLIQQETALRNDPKIGTFFKQWESDIKHFADNAGCDYDTAFTVVARNKLPDLIASLTQQGEQQAVKKLMTNAQTSPGALGAEGAEHKTGYNSMSADQRRKFREAVKRGENPTF